MNRRLFTATWSDLCGEEREQAVQLMAEAGQAAVWRLVQSGRLRGPESESFCFRAFAEEVAPAGPAWEAEQQANLDEGDLRAAAFCVAYDDERRRLLGLPAIPWHEPHLMNLIREAELQYRAALLAHGQHRIAHPENPLAGVRLALLWMRIRLLMGRSEESRAR